VVQLQKARPRIAPPEPELLPAVIESLLFIAGEPQEIGTLAKSLGVTKKQAENAIDALVGMRDERGVFVQRLGDRVQLATVPDAAPYIEQFMEVEHGTLSRASLEALAIIAYRHPVTRTTIEAVRGVNSDHAVATLEARGLIEEVGRAPGPGRPVLFAPTVRFLQYFGLQRTDDLPPLPDLPELPQLEPAGNGSAHEPDESEADEPAPSEAVEA
jgi:segregation and condensation protein B